MNEQDDIYIDLGVLLIDFLKEIKKFWYLLILLPMLGIVGMICYQQIGYVPRYSSRSCGLHGKSYL